jgi:hypothetical protein
MSAWNCISVSLPTHAAVDFQRLEVDARIGVHRVSDLAALERSRLERCAPDVPGVDVAGEPREHAAGVRLPVRREQPGERRHDVAAAVVLDRLGEVLHLRGGPDHLEVIAQPLHERPRDRDRALEAVDGLLVADLVADGRSGTCAPGT